ncbi:hypothetical protein N24_3051 [Corynebacterium suranareeae]|uniref:Uncharacterized protein n=1 Tax=Corynebacterium suranareeae TaxID=2506452 RepID=A0A169S9E4_9CORY|nr:hypothetical protein N24_3051 [Corynebacterium suranareeae]
MLRVLIVAAVVLTGCSSPDRLEDHLRLASGSSTSFSLRDIYGDEWAEFSIICPYTPRDRIEQALHISAATVPKFGFDDSYSALVLKASSDGNETEWIGFDRVNTVDLCSPRRENTDLSIQSTDTVLDFRFNTGTDVWELERLQLV